MNLSVIIPCYNCINTLKTTVDSIRTCGIEDYEILLVNDGSTDGTAELCNALNEEYATVRCIHQANAGVSAARNRGIDEARGEYIWFVDADDTVDELNMDLIGKAIASGVDCIMFGMKFLHMRREKLIMQENLSCEEYMELTPQSLGKQFRFLFEKNYFTAIWNKFIRRDVLAQNRIYFDGSLINYEDLHFSILLAACCERMVALPDTYYNYINTFGHDRTVDRIQRISDIVEYTDKIVMPFYMLDEHLMKTGFEPIDGLSEIIMWLYMEAVYFKLKTATYNELKKLCADVQKNENVLKEVHCVAHLSQANQRLLSWITNDSYIKIWGFMRYRALRSIVSRIYRITRSYLGI